MGNSGKRDFSWFKRNIGRMYKRTLEPTVSTIYTKITRMPYWFSQKGQDEWVQEVLCYKEDGFFLDIGAFDGVNDSNTCTLERFYGWKGVCVEANDTYYYKCLKNRSCNVLNLAVSSRPGVVTICDDGKGSGILSKNFKNLASIGNKRTKKVVCVPISAIITYFKIPRFIDYVSLDVEGGEYDVLLGFPFRTHIMRTLTMEGNDKRAFKLLERNGYVCLQYDRLNGEDSFWVHKSGVFGREQF